MKNKKQKNRKLKIENLLLLCIITTIAITTLTLSRYETTVAGNDSTRVAIPIINLSSNVLNVTVSPINPMQEYIFSVSNTEETKSSEVSMEYTIKVNSFGNLPLEFELYTFNNNTEGIENLFEGNGTTTSSSIIRIEDNQVRTYKLKIKWKENNKDYKLSNTIDYVQVILDSKQVD